MTEMWSLQLLQPRRLAGGNTGDGTESAENMMEDGGSEEKKKKRGKYAAALHPKQTEQTRRGRECSSGGAVMGGCRSKGRERLQRLRRSGVGRTRRMPTSLTE